VKRTFTKDGDGICSNCGRPSPPCRCGKEVIRKCSIHGHNLRVIAIPVYNGNPRVLWGWIDVSECPEEGCTRVRSCKVQDGQDRKNNRKTGQKRCRQRTIK
jgi:hypothetical protein